MASHFEKEGFSLGEKSNHMMTVTPFMGKVKTYILQFYINGNGELKPGKSGITWKSKNFTSWLNLFHKSK